MKEEEKKLEKIMVPADKAVLLGLFITLMAILLMIVSELLKT